jgi:hypothetical protein
MKELIELQKALHVPKDQEGHNYFYRTVDAILKAAKEASPENVYILLSDEVEYKGDRHYIKSTATIYNGESSLSVSSPVREPDKLGSQSAPQISGSCVTYARKKALEGLLLLDNDNENDPDNPLVWAKEKQANNDERFTLVENAKAAIHSSKMPEPKKKALLLGMPKHNDDFLRMIINGKV